MNKLRKLYYKIGMKIGFVKPLSESKETVRAPMPVIPEEFRKEYSFREFRIIPWLDGKWTIETRMPNMSEYSNWSRGPYAATYLSEIAAYNSIVAKVQASLKRYQRELADKKWLEENQEVYP